MLYKFSHKFFLHRFKNTENPQFQLVFFLNKRKKFTRLMTKIIKRTQKIAKYVEINNSYIFFQSENLIQVIINIYHNHRWNISKHGFLNFVL